MKFSFTDHHLPVLATRRGISLLQNFMPHTHSSSSLCRIQRHGAREFPLILGKSGRLEQYVLNPLLIGRSMNNSPTKSTIMSLSIFQISAECPFPTAYPDVEEITKLQKCIMAILHLSSLLQRYKYEDMPSSRVTAVPPLYHLPNLFFEANLQRPMSAAGRDTDLQPATHYIRIPDMMSSWPWPRRINPLYEEVRTEAQAWLRSFSPFSPKSQAAFEQGKFELLAALALPYGSRGLWLLFAAYSMLSDGVDVFISS